MTMLNGIEEGGQLIMASGGERRVRTASNIIILSVCLLCGMLSTLANTFSHICRMFNVLCHVLYTFLFLK